ncbi:hypothetical protein J2Z44_000409 [Clostridium punense]|uniref:Uncharacterized protein n=1 Tax=Clostridium punense TaxID=1054297 RepID=A0ABS4K048_9CLOT|nr:MULTISPECIES: hypothetical protein [Clostridium]EQB86477.1 hypothetical protein M918_14135 [Clostridium sp. BL8]MBP2020625.1 hypothetical protein [Clostridium punense]
MENNQKPKLGGGIMTISIIQLIVNAFVILGLIPLIFARDMMIGQFKTIGADIPMPTTSESIISLVLTLLLVIGIILILCKKAAGVYIYFTVVVINLIYPIVMNGFKLASLTGLILPVLMAIFIYLKREIFGFGVNAASTNPPSDMQ